MQICLGVKGLLILPSCPPLTFLSLFTVRPAGGQSGWTATAVDLFSLYVKGAVAVITIKVYLLFYSRLPFICTVCVLLSYRSIV